MSKSLPIGLAAFFAMVLLVIAPVRVAWAQEVEVEGIYTGHTSAPTRSMTFRYDAPITANVETTLSVAASGGTGSYSYKPYSLDIKEGNSWKSVLTFNMDHYSPTNNLLTYTFTMTGTYRLCWSVMDYDASTGLVIGANGYDTFYATFEVTGDGTTAAERERKAAAIAEDVWQQCKAAGCKTEYEIALWLHDWVIDHCEYDSTYRHYQPTDLFVDGRGTCEAYHGAYVQLLQKAGIQTSRVENAGHVWTGVRIDGVWCHVDTTSDDSDNDWFKLGALNRRRFFGLDDATIMAKLALDKDFIRKKTPDFTASSLQNSFIVRSGIIGSYESPFLSDIQSNLDKGMPSFSLPIPATTMAPSYKTLIYVPVAEALQARLWFSSGKTITLKVAYEDDRLYFSPDSAPMFRLYNPNSGEHFYTANAGERDHLAKVGWKYEGIGWYAPIEGDDVYRLYNPNAGDHHYTLSAAERDSLVRAGWRYEGVGWKSGGSVPLYRQYNPNAQAGSHNFTTSKGENDWLATLGWQPEGIAWYGVK